MKHGPVTLVLDQGTHASRAASIADDGSVLYHRDLAISRNRPGARRVEQNPEEILASVQRVSSAAIQIASVRVAAVMESIAFLVCTNLESMRAAGYTLTHVTAGGGLSRDDAFCQRLADTAGLEVRRVTETEITALGMARLAGNARIENPVDRVFRPRCAHPSKKRYRRFVALVGGPDD